MKKKQLCLLLALGITFAAMAQQKDTLIKAKTMTDVSVTGTRPSTDLEHLHVVKIINAEEIARMPVSTVADLLDQLPGVDLRSRGSDGVQGDLSMRGGTFDQVLVLLNGVNITDPQTGHHNMDLPIDLAMVERVEILQGTALNNFGLSAFCGAINIVTGESDSNYLRAGVEGGSYGHAKAYAGLHRNVGKWALTGSASYNRSDGYMKNTDYNYGNLFLQAVRRDTNGNAWNIQLGGQLKNFGANAFYSLAYPDQYEATKTLIGSITRNRRWDNFQLEYALFGRLHYDRFELFREGIATPAVWYSGHNYHLSDVTGANVKGSYFWLLGKTAAGVEMRNEHIVSTVLGDKLDTPVAIPFTDRDIYFTYGKTRLNLNYFVEHNFYRERFAFSLGASGNYNTLFGSGFCFSANANYRLSPSWQLFANVGRSLRLPTFTDLYYHSATQIANPNLKPEESVTYELSLHYDKARWHAQGNVYYRQGHNVIDWIKGYNETQWRSANHTEVDAAGFELNCSYTPDKWLRKVELSYAFCSLNKEAGDYLSKYALDYLHNKISLSVSHNIFSHFSADWQLSWQQREGTYMDVAGNVTSYTPALLLNGRLNYTWKVYTFYIDASNILDKDYYDYGGILQPGVMLNAGVMLNY